MKINITSLALIATATLSLLLASCASTVSFRASPISSDTAQLSCLDSSSGECKFELTDNTQNSKRLYRLAAGKSISVAVPPSGAEVRGCATNKPFSSCSTVHVAAGGTATTNASARGL